MADTRRIRVAIEGIVQGVGFRPFVYRLAHSLGLAGWVQNTPAGVLLEAEGKTPATVEFLRALEHDAPPLAVVTSLTTIALPPAGSTGFVILESGAGRRSAQVAPDGDVCPDCLRELFDPGDRRHRYPFINCTNCGPRYSIITGIPYDRAFTTMAPFAMCPACRAEYDDPAHRRFHAQPNACPECGPRLELTSTGGSALPGDPLEEALRLLAEGNILAIKGVGGFHLAVDATNDTAVMELRRRKQRDEKPFALMAAGSAEISRFALLDDSAARLLNGPERPIVLLPKRHDHAISPAVAPLNAWFGVMLPAAPLHHLLLREHFTALVMTSGNIADEPIVYRDDDARQRLQGIADYVLGHNREIHTRCDDSVLRFFRGEPLFIRRSRGYVPRAVRLPAPQPAVLAVGAELKGALCLTRGEQGFLSQHIGDLKNAATLRSLEESAAHLQRLLEITPDIVAHDLHPDYLSGTYAGGIPGAPKVAVQHHHAHMASCMAEHRIEGPAIGIIFDGTGYGSDGTVWGGEILVGGYDRVRRAGHLACVPLPGGDAAAREPYRMAAAHLHPLYGEELFSLPLPCWEGVDGMEQRLLLAMIRQGINSPLTSSCGRLFDAVAALLGLRRRVSYEGQAAMELEALAEEVSPAPPYPFNLVSRGEATTLDLGPMFRMMLAELADGVPRPVIARRFHATVAHGALELSLPLRDEGDNRVVLSGGVFQNRLLTEELASLLEANRFQVYTHRLVPPNDGGIALGQAVIAGRTVL